MAGLFLVLDGGEIKTGHVSSLAVKNGAQEAVFFFFKAILGEAETLIPAAADRTQVSCD